MNEQLRELNVDALAQEIRRVDGAHTLGAAALAEALAPFINSLLPQQPERSEIDPSLVTLIDMRGGYTVTIPSRNRALDAAIAALQAAGQRAVACGGCGETEADKRCVGCLHPFHSAQQPEAVDALEVFRISGGDTECEPNPTADRAIEVLRDLRECYDELLAKQPEAGGAVAWTKDATDYGNALNEAAWVFVEECPEKSALLFNNTKKPLRAAILKYAELVAPLPPLRMRGMGSLIRGGRRSRSAPSIPKRSATRSSLEPCGTPPVRSPTVAGWKVRKECPVCGHQFSAADDETDLCPSCEMDEELQREMDRDVE